MTHNTPDSKQEAPERFWIAPQKNGRFTDTFRVSQYSAFDGATEYIRADLACSRVSVAAVEGDAETKAKAIVEEYKQRVIQLPSGDAVPCAKWLEMRLRIAFDLAATPPEAPVVAAKEAAEEIANDRLGPRSDGPSFWDKYAAKVAAIITRHFPPTTSPVLEIADNNEPLTDAQVDAWLEAHKDDPVDPAQANRVEWLFRKKLAASIVEKAQEWLRYYDERVTQGGKGAQAMKRLYGEEAIFHKEVIRVVETLALEPPSFAEPVTTAASEMRQMYEAARRAGLSSVEGRTFEEWEQKVSDYRLDDARQALLSEREHFTTVTTAAARAAAEDLNRSNYLLSDATQEELAEVAAIISKHCTAGVEAGGDRPRIICLCGSTRFVDTWINEYQRLSDEGNIVLTVARMPPRPNLQHDEPELKTRLDNLHLRKIDLADEVFVLNVDGYIGSSTRSEIAYATSKGKTINYLDAAAALRNQGEGK